MAEDEAAFPLVRVRVTLEELPAAAMGMRALFSVRELGAWLQAGERRAVGALERIAGVHYVELLQGEKMVARGSGRDDLAALFDALRIAREAEGRPSRKAER